MVALSLPNENPAGRFGKLRQGFSSRAELLARRAPESVSAPSFKLVVGEMGTLAKPLFGMRSPSMEVAPALQKRVVMLLPGFGTHPRRMRYLAKQLEDAGHVVKQWGQGWNLGPTQECLDHLVKRLDQLHRRYGQEVVLVGWSLGGIFAREIAKLRPDCVAKVISMGSPFSGSPYANNVWRLYEMVTGHSVESPPVNVRLKEKPPVETVAFWSARDGMIAPRSAAGRPGERDRAERLRCTHIGFPNSPEAVRAILKELDRR